MKPIKLSMTAFGPYKYKETIDFTQLQERHLYVISGDTGSGKTTIFDGICFALYGSASGQDRDNADSLRSDFADDDTHTVVELVFEWKDRTYRILRQLGHIKRGNKSKTGDRNEFFEIIGEDEVPCVDRQIVSEINEKVEELLGLTQDQFKQIVMLPQGEFRKLLTSKTENKEEILRRLFKTDDYKQIGEQLNKRRIALQEAFDKVDHSLDLIKNRTRELPIREQSQLQDVLQREHFHTNQLIHALRNEASHYEQACSLNEKSVEKANKDHERAHTQLSEAKALNDKFLELANQSERLERLSTKKPAMKEKERAIEQAERASHITPIESVAQEAKEDLQRIVKLVADEESKRVTAREHFNRAKETYEIEKGKDEERKLATKRVTDLEAYVPVVKNLQAMKEQRIIAERQLENAKKEATDVDTLLKQRREDYEQLSKQVEESNERLIDETAKNNKLNDMRAISQSVQAYINETHALQAIDTQFSDAKKAFDEAKKLFNTLENKLWNNHAAMLASHLHDEESCPVCGSVEHPNKAAFLDDDVTRSDVEAQKKVVSRTEEAYIDVRTERQSKMTRIEELSELLKEEHVPMDDIHAFYEQFVKEGKQLKKEVDALAVLREKTREAEKRRQQVYKDIQIVEERTSKMRDHLQAVTNDYEAKKTLYNDRLTAIPEAYQQLSVLNTHLEEAREESNALEKALEKAEENVRLAERQLIEIETNKKGLDKQQVTIVEREDKARKRWQEALEASDFSSEHAYQSAKQSKDTVENWKKELSAYQEEIAVVSEQVVALRKQLSGKEKQDIKLLMDTVERLRSMYEQYVQQLNRSQQLLKDVQSCIEDATIVYEQLKNHERKLAVVTDLTNVIRGHNEKKISFERFLQMEYLDQIIQAANLRLQMISSGQYQLVRSNRQESHGRQSGLSFDVYDAYTGRNRDVKTLSGGEKFNASLCLALGMSDVIQSFQGNITIDTMFIDEGFGSLDEESLHKAIDKLIDLQKLGRTIGVISHVKELKEMFPAVLEVTKAKEGYSKTKFLLK